MLTVPFRKTRPVALSALAVMSGSNRMFSQPATGSGSLRGSGGWVAAPTAAACSAGDSIAGAALLLLLPRLRRPEGFEGPRGRWRSVSRGGG